MQFTAEIIANFLNGEIAGNPDTVVSSVAKIEEGVAGSLAFLSNPKYEHHIYNTEASIVIVNKDFVPQHEVKATLVKVDDAYAAFAKLLDLYVASKPQKSGISTTAAVGSGSTFGSGAYVGEYAVVGEGVTTGENVRIYPQTYIGDNVKLGNNVTLHAGVKIYEDCVIGDNVIIHSGSVIGADGFGFAPVDGVFKKIPQIGNVVIENDVEIGANTCIDRATMGSTVIKHGVKLDNLIQIGHNVVIGENTVAASQTGIAGSTKIGAGCMFGGQVGIVGHISVAAGVKVGSQSGVHNTIKNEGESHFGSPTIPGIGHYRSYSVFKNLPEIQKQIIRMEQQIKELTEQLETKK